MRKKSLNKFKDSLRAKTKRTRGDSLASIVTDLNRTLRGWFGYFKHAHHFTFERLGEAKAFPTPYHPFRDLPLKDSHNKGARPGHGRRPQPQPQAFPIRMPTARTSAPPSITLATAESGGVSM